MNPSPTETAEDVAATGREPTTGGAGRPLYPPVTMSEKPTVTGLFQVEEGALLRFVYGIVRQRETAEEIVQEAFIKLHRHWDEVDNPKAWLYRAARNLALNQLRKSKRESPEGDRERIAVDEATPGENLERMEAVGMVRMLIEELGHQDRTMLHLKFHENCTYARIGEQLGLSISNVGYRLHHLLKDLASALESAGVQSSQG